eukprot:9480350-Pyramimonas_sp.AAC.1
MLLSEPTVEARSHVASHGKSLLEFQACSRCRFMWLSRFWDAARRWPVDPGDSKCSSSWLEGRHNKSGWGVSCTVCSAAGINSPLGRGSVQAIRTNVFDKHHTSPAHVRAVAAMLGKPVEVPLAAPSSEDFLKAWKGGGTAAGSEYSYHKHHQMRSCLAEAKRVLARGFLKRSVCISLYSDGRAGRLLIRYRAVAPDLTVRSGVLGQTQQQARGKTAASDNRAIVADFERVIDRFATPGAALNRHGLRRPLSEDRQRR